MEKHLRENFLMIQHNVNFAAKKTQSSLCFSAKCFVWIMTDLGLRFSDHLPHVQAERALLQHY